MDGLNTVLEYLTSVPAWYLATSVDGQPHVRPFSFGQRQMCIRDSQRCVARAAAKSTL